MALQAELAWLQSQLGKYLGATVIATGTSEEKLEFTKKWGADHTL